MVCVYGVMFVVVGLNSGVVLDGMGWLVVCVWCSID